MHDADATLVRLAQRGDARAFGVLVQRHLQSAYAVALARLGEPADAEDVCQDAFITALERIEECRKPEQFGAWLMVIVRNRAVDVLRFHAVRKAVPLSEETELAAREDTERELEQRELRKDLLEAVRVLTELQREVLLLFDFEGWSHRDIAARLGISEGSARVHLHNGRKALREQLSSLHQERT